MTARTIPTLPTWTAGMRVTGANLAAMVAYQQFWADPPMFRMRQIVVQSLSNATFTQITCDTNDYDTEGGRSGSAPYSYTIPAAMAGRWRFWWYITWANNATGGRAAGLYRNGSLATPYVVASASTGGLNNASAGNETIAVAGGDVMSMWGYQNSGGSLNTAADGFPTYSAFGGQLVSLANP